MTRGESVERRSDLDRLPVVVDSDGLADKRERHIEVRERSLALGGFAPDRDLNACRPYLLGHGPDVGLELRRAPVRRLHPSDDGLVLLARHGLGLVLTLGSPVWSPTGGASVPLPPAMA